MGSLGPKAIFQGSLKYCVPPLTITFEQTMSILNYFRKPTLQNLSKTCG